MEFVALGPGRDELTMRVWERGVGETLACGTGLGGRRRRTAPLGPSGSQGDRQPARGRRRGRAAPGRCSGAQRPEPPGGGMPARSGRLARAARARRGGRRWAPMSLIERAFREKIVLVGVTLPAPGQPAGPSEAETERHLDELALAGGYGGGGRGRPRPPAPGPARPCHLHRARAKHRTYVTCPSRPTPTRWCSTTSCRRPSRATWKRSWAERPSTVRP